MSVQHDLSKELQYQVQIGSKMYPEYPCSSVAQAFYELKKALGIASSSYHSISPTRLQYQHDHFIVGVDTEKVIEAGFTGLNTKQGDLMTIRCKNANSYDTAQPFFLTLIKFISCSIQIIYLKFVRLARKFLTECLALTKS